MCVCARVCACVRACVSAAYHLVLKSVHTLFYLYNISYKNRTNKNNITRISMAIKYHIIKHRAFFFQNVMFYMAFGAVGGQCEKLRRYNFVIDTSRYTLSDKN